MALYGVRLHLAPAPPSPRFSSRNSGAIFLAVLKNQKLAPRGHFSTTVALGYGIAAGVTLGLTSPARPPILGADGLTLHTRMTAPLTLGAYAINGAVTSKSYRLEGRMFTT